MPVGQRCLPRTWPLLGSSWVFCRWESWQPGSTVSLVYVLFPGRNTYRCRLLCGTPHVHPDLVNRNSKRPDEAIETLRLNALCPFVLRGNAKTLRTGSVTRINNWKINLSFPCHKLKAYRPYNMSKIEVSRYWWRSQSSLSRTDLYYTI